MLAVLATLFRKPLLAAFGLQLISLKRRRLTQQEMRSTIARLRNEAKALKEDRNRVEALLTLRDLEVSESWSIAPTCAR